MTESITTTKLEKVKQGNKTVTKTVKQVQTVVLASASYKLARGKSGSVNLALNAAGKAALANAAKHHVTETLTVSAKGGKTTSKAVVVS
jgi:hypothetical protein